MIGKSIIILDSVDSTNNYVAKAIRQGTYVWGTAILAHFQTNGRGQREAIWQSASGQNLTFSFGLELKEFDPRSFFTLSRAISLALYQYLYDELGEGIKIKWPNDMLFNHKKIAGVLIENRLAKTPIAICGIGLNVNQTSFENLAKATSLKSETNRNYSIENVLDELLKHLNNEWRILNLEDFRTQQNRYDDRLFGIHEDLSFNINGELITGKVQGTTSDGKIQIDLKGSQRSFLPKEIGFLY